MLEIKNAKITSTSLGTEDHGIMTCYLHLDYGGACQGFGGYALDGPIKDKDGKFIKRQGGASGMDLIIKILEVLEVGSWEKLPGTVLRVESEHNRVTKIGHFLKDKWLDIELHFKEFSHA